jgi:TonB family protein
LAVEGDSNSVGGDTGGPGTGNGAGGFGGGPGTGDAGDPVLAEIRRRIEQSKRYPMQARAQHVEGRVGVRFHIQPDGRLSDVRVTRSSGIPILDEAAIQAVQHSAPLPYYEHPIDLSLAFRLR